MVVRVRKGVSWTKEVETRLRLGAVLYCRPYIKPWNRSIMTQSIRNEGELIGRRFGRVVCVGRIANAICLGR